MTQKKLENFLDNPVKLVDFEGEVFYGWFVKHDSLYYVFPFDWHQSICVLKASYIKSIMFLTNGLVVK